MKHDIHALELFIARFLRYGVMIAGALMLVGWISQISFSNDTFAQFHVYREMRLVPTLIQLFHAREWGLLTSYLGMFVLLCLPVIRVLMTFAVFIKKRDYALACVSALVLFGLLLSVTLGLEI